MQPWWHIEAVPLLYNSIVSGINFPASPPPHWLTWCPPLGEFIRKGLAVNLDFKSYLPITCVHSKQLLRSGRRQPICYWLAWDFKGTSWKPSSLLQVQLYQDWKQIFRELCPWYNKKVWKYMKFPGFPGLATDRRLSTGAEQGLRQVPLATLRPIVH